MLEINFTKLTGAGNDFILIDKKLNPNLEIAPNLIENLCDRRFGIGADGMLVIADDDDLDFEMEYYNSDGSTGMLCGNGARCIIKYASFTGRIKGTKTKFRFQSTLYSGEVLDKNEIKFNLNPPTDIQNDIAVEVLGRSFRAAFINTGAHHVVIDLDKQSFDESEMCDIEKFPVSKYGREIRYSSQFAPLGTNVNFISKNGDEIKIRTYERGVEQETFACGTGSVASAIIAYINGYSILPINLRTKSGALLKVDFKNLNDEVFENVTLSGPAKIVFEGRIKI
ncbi:Diaminopimelate epimerase [hydrothermal vent metagenome]|uniref:diaminopimelate epimerase n=1 Tax=hydrothermal vent metagenome TaxID=652676 RepID=A0A3B1DDD5_9ZZZZ